MSLFYLLPSLPMLHFDITPGITPAKFIETCHEQLAAGDAAAAEALFYEQPSDHPFVAAWRDKEAILRNAIARHRARIAGKDAAHWTRPTQGCDSQIESEVTDAFQEPDPLIREKELDKVRWLISDELQGPDPLSIKAVFAYAIKLAVITRWAKLSAEQGRKRFDTLTQIPITLEPVTGNL
jgi:hypothetical protein